MGDNHIMTTEPLSNLRPPDTTDASIPSAADAKARPAGSSKVKEWVIVDYNPRTFPGGEIFLPGLWKRMHDDETFEMFFHEGPQMGFWDFVNVLSGAADTKVQLVIGHDADGNAIEHAGLVMLNHILFTPAVHRAVGNFLFFHDYWNRHDSEDLGWAVLNNWFGVLDADTIAGLTPELNRAALLFVKRLGFKESGRVPDFTTYGQGACATVTTYMTRDMWKAAHARRYGTPPAEGEHRG